jgi:hypothetical protein
MLGCHKHSIVFRFVILNKINTCKERWIIIAYAVKQQERATKQSSLETNYNQLHHIATSRCHF